MLAELNREARQRRDSEEQQCECALQVLLDQLLKDHYGRGRPASDEETGAAAACERDRRLLARVFLYYHEEQHTRDVPSYLTDVITKQLIRDPVITPDGHTYDRSSICGTRVPRTRGSASPVHRPTGTRCRASGP